MLLCLNLEYKDKHAVLFRLHISSSCILLFELHFAKSGKGGDKGNVAENVFFLVYLR